jgi:aminodeoxyfutalosine deaminase
VKPEYGRALIVAREGHSVVNPDTDDIAAFVAALPKAELHLHLIGCATPETVLALAREHPHLGVPSDPEELRRYYEFTDFAHFLEVYAQVCDLVRSAEDVLILLDDVGAQLAADGVRYAEIQVGPLRHRAAGIGYAELAEALSAGRDLVADHHGVELGWIIAADTAHGLESAEAALEFATRHRPRGTVGLGLGGPEVGAPRSAFARVFTEARDAGLRAAPHAGETVGPAEVWSALRDLHADRIGHGIAAAADPALCAHLAETGIALEVCPTSNLRTGAVASLAEHPIRTLLDAGVPVTLATDDPAMFGADLNREYELCHTLWGLAPGELADLARASARAAFCSAERRDAILAEIDAVCDHFAVPSSANRSSIPAVSS